MINSTNPIVRNALGIGGGSVATNARLPNTGEYKAAKQAWDKANFAFQALIRLAHSTGGGNTMRGRELGLLSYKIDKLMCQFT